jgi:isochorismate hydrolase
MPHVRSPQRLDCDRSGLLVIDLQEKLLPVVPSGHAVIRQVHRLLDAAEILKIPFAATVQYPQGLGPLEASLGDRIPSVQAKTAFSAAVCRDAIELWLGEGRDQVVVTGIETPICIMQTVLDLLAEGVEVFVAAEAVAARDGRAHEISLDRMRDCGATVLPVESVLFEWCSDASRPEFKAISALVKKQK